MGDAVRSSVFETVARQALWERLWESARERGGDGPVSGESVSNSRRPCSRTVTEETTSSSAMMMSAPMRFWMWMECSGVSSIRSPSTGDWKLTPSSVMSAKCNKDTCTFVVAAHHKAGQ